MDNEYVRNDVFQEIIRRIEAQNAASEARTAALIAEIRADVKAYKADSDAKLEVYRAESKRESESLASDIKAIRDRLDAMENAAGRRWTIISVIAGVIAVLITAAPYLPAIKTLLGV
ncbi:MAG: hypothetical protein IJR85_04675 [Synergistaceae bacterium]|nr:hypothetical protein [Synergistaceae bacterium]